MVKTHGPLGAGAAKVDITPPDLTGLTNLFRRPFTGVHDPIYVRALVLDNGLNTVAIVAADLVEFGDTLAVRQRIEQEISIPADHVLLTASHDHNAPRAGKVTAGATAWAGGPATEKYTGYVYDQVVEVVRQAKAALQPARVGIGCGTADVNVNRDEFTPEGWKIGVNPQGPSDKTVWVVKFEALSGEPIALLMNYAVHAVVISSENRLVTGEISGAAERYVEQSYQDKVVALWTIGAAADQNPRYMADDGPFNPGSRGDGYGLMEAQGYIVGEEVVQVARQIQQMTAEVCLEAEQRVVTLPARPPTHQPASLDVQPAGDIPLHLGLVLINHIALTSVSGEVATRIYQHLKKDSPFTNTLMITMTNDRIGYIIDDAAYDTPTFESRATPIQRGYAEAAIVNGLVEMMGRYQ